jgi:hypothetical protein
LPVLKHDPPFKHELDVHLPVVDPVTDVSVVVNIPVGVVIVITVTVTVTVVIGVAVIVVTDPTNVSHCRPVCVDGQTQNGAFPFIIHVPLF